LYEFLKLPSLPKKHRSDGVGWEIAEYIQVEVLKVTKLVVKNSKFISLTYDEVIAMDNANVYGYIMHD
jgi:hypothetical protein